MKCGCGIFYDGFLLRDATAIEPLELCGVSFQMAGGTELYLIVGAMAGGRATP